MKITAEQLKKILIKAEFWDIAQKWADTLGEHARNFELEAEEKLLLAINAELAKK